MSLQKTVIVWREWFNATAVKAITAMGTMPRNETEIDIAVFDDGESIAREIAEECSREDHESFREGGRIVILEPAEYAGTYDITTEYMPHFSADRIAEEDAA